MVDPLTAVVAYKLMDIPMTINVISSSVSTISNIISSVSSSQSTHLVDINTFLASSDIRVNLLIYTSLLNELKDSKSETVNICVINIHEVIKEIEAEMLIVDQNKKFNDSLYLNWRAYSFKENVKRLELLVKKLEIRIKSLKTAQSILTAAGLNKQINK